MKTIKAVTTIRVDTELLKKARAKGISIASALQSTLEKVVNEKKCPTCGQGIKING